MTLSAIVADLIAAPPDPTSEAQLRGYVWNLLSGLSRHHIEIDAANRRVSRTIHTYNTLGHRTPAALLLAYSRALIAFDETDHYRRPGPLVKDVAKRAVTILINEDGLLGNFWLGRRASAREIADEFSSGNCMGKIGGPGRPIWLTPYTGDIEKECELAIAVDYNYRELSAIARRIVGTLGLCHVHANDELLAFVTHKTIGELSFVRPDDGRTSLPVGSTAIEARGHRRFRPWPHPSVGDPYGRTYELDELVRQSPQDLDYGAPEAVRPSLEMSDFCECIPVGTVVEMDFEDSDETYLREIGANETLEALLLELAKVTGL